ncbi:unnamed protein product [Orchesella dallaii]|uniref:Golgi-associated plant pathogenesis-related protein 1 n=1 Tax=Orchesella dallaii TaxID=48710 RepID=A0ABP1R306_9HEXA
MLGVSAEKVVFYEHANFEGSYFTVTINGNGCYNFPSNWNDRISSINTQGHCIIASENGDCTGKSERIAPGTPSHSHLSAFDFNDLISSFKLCGGGGEASPPSTVFPNPPPPPTSGSDLWRLAVSEHSKYRRRHAVPDLRADNAEIHRTAQRYADYLANSDKFEHSGNKNYGENLAYTSIKSKEEAVVDAVRRWYNEIQKYNYNRPGFSMATGHFTALVWKSTTHVGIGVAWNARKNWWVVVANYSPPGNSGSGPNYRENVLPPSNKL